MEKNMFLNTIIENEIKKFTSFYLKSLARIKIKCYI